MTKKSFSLIPFPAPNIPEITITGNISRQSGVLRLHYTLAGSIKEVFLPPPSTHPNRKDELWKTTCFEFFLAIKDQPQYWEFNMSPSDDWNVYCMDAYRGIGFREESSIQQLPFDFKTGYNGCSLNISVNLHPIIQPQQNINIGVATILQTKDGNITYWALLHPAPQADFHFKESFICTL